MSRSVALIGAALISAAATPALSETPPEIVERAIELLGESISFRTVEGDDDIRLYAERLADFLRKNGFAEADVEVDATGPAPTLVAIYQGESDDAPIILSGHMDVVEAKPEDWEQDPFKMTRTDEFVIGRGAVDNKFDVTMMATTLARLKAEGFKPARDLILALSGDEETQMKSTAILAKRFKNASLVLNGDGGGGTLKEDGSPLAYSLQTAEKTYADFVVTFTNPGGHSSRPTRENAIYSLARAVDRIGAFEFPVSTSETTLEFFRRTGAMTEGPLGEAMLRFAANPQNKKALKALRSNPEYVGQTGTTCVATMLSGGHALNALPQRASVFVNCRIFPGVDPEDVRKTLVSIVDDPAATIEFVDRPNYSDGSPLTDDIVAAVRKAVDSQFKDLPIIPSMSSGASDSLYFRAEGVPSYGVSGLFLKPSDDFSHGLNERAPIASVKGALDHWHTLLIEIAK
ncbi:MAG: M20/M25/M40 family metallo-hydrolase [Parvularculaceae bacterium]|nr:M20/M25/M40 family metallo-hydrolase [Parvularculaceae bacterium]